MLPMELVEIWRTTPPVRSHPRIKKQYGIESVAHLTCVNSSKDDVQEMIDRLVAANIENVLALRGDISEDGDMKHDFHHANELAIEVQRKCRDSLEILGACYPEGHYESKFFRRRYSEFEI